MKYVAHQVKVADPADVTPPENLTRSSSNANVRKRLAVGFRRAREWNGWDQREAAHRMGYANSTQLSLIEAGKRNTPLTVICVASTVYGVSADYLLGYSDDADRNSKIAERQAMLRHVESLLGEHAIQIADKVTTYVSAATEPMALTHRMLAVSTGAIESFRKFQVLNDQTWQDLRGGAMLLKKILELEGVAEAAIEALGRQERMAIFADGKAAPEAQPLSAIAPGPRPKTQARRG